MKGAKRKHHINKSISICSLSSRDSQTSIRSFFTTASGPLTPPRSRLRRCVQPQTPPTPAIGTGLTPQTPPTPTAADTAAAPKRVVSVSSSKVVNKKRPKKKHQQLYLDLGQRNFAANTVCSICGMLAVQGLAEDSKQHTRVCQDFLHGVPFFMTQQRVLRTWQLQARKRAKRNSVHSSSKGSSAAAIIEIRPTDSSALRKKVAQVREIVDQELGFAEQTGNEETQYTAYLCIVDKRVVGMVLAQAISRGYLLVSSSSASGSTTAAGAGSLERSKTPAKASLGIHQMWVHAKFRKHGIASELIDAARAQMIFGFKVPVHQLAFSSPTESGVQFARHYNARRQGQEESLSLQPAAVRENVNVLVYDCGIS